MRTDNKANAFYAQSGGVTAAINATASSVIATVRQHESHFGTLYAGKNGILGMLREELIDTACLTSKELTLLSQTPGGVFGSCRYQLGDVQKDALKYQRLIDVCAAHNIRYFFYNGGGDSMDTAHKVAKFSEKAGYPIHCVGIPKTVDNDLAHTDTCPGFGSVAKYVAVSVQEATLDIASMCDTSTKVFIMEVMGRHAGWIALAGGLASRPGVDNTPLILFPERPYEEQRFLDSVDSNVKKHGYSVVVASEGIRDNEGDFLSASGLRDAFGHAQLGGVAPLLAATVKNNLGYKYHWAVADYLQRAARHIASATDIAQSKAVGHAAVEYALLGAQGVMIRIVRDSDKPYYWHLETIGLEKIANQERKVPADYITNDGFGITTSARDYLEPLIAGEDYPSYRHGVACYLTKQLDCVKPLLTPFSLAGKG